MLHPPFGVTNISKWHGGILEQYIEWQPPFGVTNISKWHFMVFYYGLKFFPPFGVTNISKWHAARKRTEHHSATAIRCY